MLWIGVLACSGPNDGPKGDEPDTIPPDTSTGTTDTDPPTDTGTIPDPNSPALVFDGDRPRNVLMLSIDTTRRDHVAPYGPDNAPFLTGLMAESVRLDDHQQCSNWTFASTTCTLQGRYHEEQGYIPDFGPIMQTWVPDGQRSFAVRLGERGYVSALVSPNGWMSFDVNNAQGYDSFRRPGTGLANALADEGMYQIGRLLDKGDPSRPWLLHIHFMEPHPPYIPPVEFITEELPPLPYGVDLDTQPNHYIAIGQWPNLSPEDQASLEANLRARYAAEIRWFDFQLQSIWQRFETNGFLDDTLVVFWSDHGEQFWEHGQQTHAWHLGAEENDGLAFFWARNLRSVAWPWPTHAVDLLPTTLDALDLLDDPSDPTLSGHVIGSAPSDRSRFGMTVARGGGMQSITGASGFKLVFLYRTGEVELYDRNTDPTETNNLYTPDHPEVAPLWAQLLPRIEAMSALLPNRTLVWPEDLPSPKGSGTK